MSPARFSSPRGELAPQSSVNCPEASVLSRGERLSEFTEYYNKVRSHIERNSSASSKGLPCPSPLRCAMRTCIAPTDRRWRGRSIWRGGAAGIKVIEPLATGVKAMATTSLTERISAACGPPSGVGAERETAAHRSKTSVLAECRLRASPYLSLRNIYCDFHEGMLILRGCLPTYYMKQHAQAAVAGVEGVGRVVNQIEVCSTNVRRSNS
jgi:hypothetical protein